MSTRRSMLWGCALSAAAVLALPSLAQAQAPYPNKTIRLVVPNPAGGLPDTVARLFAQRLGERLGQPVVVDNKPGANGVVAAQALATAPADGYTYLVTDGSMFSINPAIYKNLNYDYQRDFMPVSLAARAPLYLAVHPKVGVSTLAELIALAKARPGVLTYGSSGVGSTHHLTMEAMKSALGIDLRHIPYKGSSQSVPALIGGQVDVAFSALPSLSGFVKNGQVKLLGNNAAQRSGQEPGVPAIAETIPGFDFAPTIGVFAARGTPASVIERFSAEMAHVARLPELVQSLNSAGIVAVGAGPAEFDQAIQGEIRRLAQAISAAGLKTE
ncbi:MAG: tripartite tricarboxylate transporter substrate-binding protein [Hylemonella sp.]|nr:tripartite tricarboxylate transporter substrate-binding protein [Hylemonella sp.]